MEKGPVVVADLVFDGVELRTGTTYVEISGGFIRDVSGDGADLRGRDVVDARGLLVMPGMINTHTHTARGGMFDPDEMVSINSIVRNFRDMLSAGVTGLGEMGNAAGLVYSLRECFRARPGCGPDIFGCGPLITAPGGYPLDWMPPMVSMLGVALPCATEEEGRKAVRAVAGCGMDGVKLAIMHRSYSEKPIPAMSLEVARAVVDESHSLGKKTYCHAHYLEDYDVALRAGVDALMHSCFEPLEPEMVERVKASGVFYCPTLSIFDNALRGLEECWDRDPRYLGLVSRRVARDWTEFRESFEASPGVVPSGIAGGLPVERGREALANAAANFRLLVEAGVPVIFGTDSTYGFGLLGRPVDELVAMRNAGMPTLECLRSATSNAAEALGMKGSGVIRQGARADLVIVDSAAAEDVAAVERVVGVIRAGRLLDDMPLNNAARALRTSFAIMGGVARTLAWAVTRRPG